MKYIYFVSYVKAGDKGVQVGMAEMISYLPITTFGQLEEMGDALMVKHGATITIMNWRLLRSESAII